MSIGLLQICALFALGNAQSKEIFLDADGNAISNNEFVDIRMANPNYPDASIVRILENGIKEFRLQKVPQEGMTAPSFSFKTLEGKRISTDVLRGKVVVLNLWFIGCPACHRQETVMNEAKAKFDSVDDVVFVAVTADGTHAVRDYLRNRPSLLLQAADAKSVVDSFKTKTFPRCVVIGRDGKIAYWRTVVHATDKFESIIRAELAKSN